MARFPLEPGLGECDAGLFFLCLRRFSRDGQPLPGLVRIVHLPPCQIRAAQGSTNPVRGRLKVRECRLHHQQGPRGVAPLLQGLRREDPGAPGGGSRREGLEECRGAAQKGSRIVFGRGLQNGFQGGRRFPSLEWDDLPHEIVGLCIFFLGVQDPCLEKAGFPVRFRGPGHGRENVERPIVTLRPIEAGCQREAGLPQGLAGKDAVGDERGENGRSLLVLAGRRERQAEVKTVCIRELLLGDGLQGLDGLGGSAPRRSGLGFHPEGFGPVLLARGAIAPKCGLGGLRTVEPQQGPGFEERKASVFRGGEPLQALIEVGKGGFHLSALVQKLSDPGCDLGPVRALWIGFEVGFAPAPGPSGRRLP